MRPTLTRLAVALSRRRAYAPTHPMVSQAEVALADELIPWLAGGRILALGVAHRELLVDSVPLDAGGTVARDLAERLHRRGVGALTLQRGVTLEGLRALLGWLASEAEPDENDPPPSAVGIAVGRVAYDRLALADDESVKAEVDALWRALAEAAFDDDHAYRGRLEDSAPEEVADAIRRHARDTRFAERVGFVLGTLAHHVSRAPDAVRDVIGERLQRVMRRIGESSIAAIVKAVGQGREQRRFLSAMVDVLPVEAVIEWLEIAGRATDQELSHHLLRILSKLSVHAGASRSRRDSQDTFREAARHLVHEWELGDPNPDEHVALLDQIAMLGATVPLGNTSAMPAASTMSEAAIVGAPIEAARLVQMACELDEPFEDALQSVEVLIGAGQSLALLEWLAQAPGPHAARKLRAQMLSPAALTAALLREPFDADAAKIVLADVDSDMAPVLLDALAAAGSRTARRMIYDRLRVEGPALFPEIRRRLNANPPWFFVRNLLALLRDIGVRLGGSDSGLWISDVANYQAHSREQVRLEALRLLVQDPRSRDAAICRALDDPSPRVIAAGIDAAHSMVSDAGEARVTLSRDLATRLMRAADVPEMDEAERARAVRALAAAPGPTVRTWLLQLASQRSKVLRRLRLAPRRPSVDAALDLLAAQYATDPAVARLLLQRRSS